MRIPLPSPRLRTAYQKLRQRGAIDFPLLSLALAAEVAPDDTVEAISLVVSALGSRPRVVSGLDEVAVGRPPREVIEAVAQQAHKQLPPAGNPHRGSRRAPHHAACIRPARPARDRGLSR